MPPSNIFQNYQGIVMMVEPIHGSGALGRTLCLYLEEKAQEDSAAAVIRAVVNAEFELQARSEIQIEYGFAGFDDFFEYFIATSPQAGTGSFRKQDLQARFKHCRRDPRGVTCIDYAARVWRLVRR